MKSILTFVRPSCVGWVSCAILVCSGCSESVTSRDVEAAKQKADAEHRDLDKVRAQSPDHMQKVEKEAIEAREADRNLKETEMKAAATTARDAYVANVEARFMVADIRIDELQKASANQQAPAKTDTDRKIADIKLHRDHAKDTLSKLKGAELLQWEQYRAEVQRHVDAMNAAMN